MNRHMKVSLPTLRLLLGLFTLFLISACSDDGSSSSSTTSDLNTVNVYFTENEISTFNPNTRLPAPRTEYDEGEQTLLTLNTDNDKQGYESVIYINDGTIYSMDSETLVESPLANLDGEVCIFPNAAPDQTAFEGSTKGERILIDQTSIYVIPRTNNKCDKEAASIVKVDFTDENDITINNISAAHFWGETLLDYAYTPSDTNSDDEDSNNPGRYGFLGANYNTQKDGLQIKFYDHESKTLWETSLPFANALPTIQQVTQTEVLVQVDGKLYLHPIAKLFDIATIDSGSIPTEDKIAALFNKPINPEKLLSITDISQLQIAGNGSTFALVDDGAVWFYDEAQTEFRNLTDKNNSVLDVQIKMTDDGTLLIHRTFANSESLVSINTALGSEPITIAEEPKVNFHTQDNNIYINMFSQTGWQATWLNTFSLRTTFENSIFVFAENTRTANSETEIFLIASDTDSTADGYLTKPNLYAFDPANETTGRKQYTDDKKLIKDFIFGEFSVTVKAISNSKIINDVYGRLELDSVRADEGIDIDVTEIYFFNPTEQTSHDPEAEDPNINKTLQLIEFKEDTI